jgi:catechol 2,3-dioxygenase-like lactoylglutathione lyase family enzyme
MPIIGIDHVQLAMPPGGEDRARAFYAGLLGIPEVPKPAPLSQRGGAWFALPGASLHLGVEQEFRPARKAHPALLVQDLVALMRLLREAGYELTEDAELEGYDRCFVNDPFGNRIELMERRA